MNTTLENITPKLSNGVYDKLKFTALILLPALSTLYFALGQVWHWPNVEEIVGSITAVDAFLGLLLGINSKVHQDAAPQVDGQIVVNDTGEGLVLKLQPNKNPAVMVTQDFLVFRTVHADPTPEENA